MVETARIRADAELLESVYYPPKPIDSLLPRLMFGRLQQDSARKVIQSEYGPQANTHG